MESARSHYGRPHERWPVRPRLRLVGNVGSRFGSVQPFKTVAVVATQATSFVNVRNIISGRPGEYLAGCKLPLRWL